MTVRSEDGRLRVHARTGTLRWAIDGFLLDCRARDLTDDTLDYYRRKLAPLVASLVEQGVQRADQLTLLHVQTYLATLRETGMSAANLHAHARALRAWLHWLVANDLAEPAMLKAFRMPIKPKSIREGFDRAAVAALLEAAGGTALPERDIAIVLLMYDTGLRASEVCGIRDCDCDLDRVKVMGKGRRERYVPISAKTRKALAKWRRLRGESEHLFITVRDEPMDRQTLYKLFRRLGEAAGISPCHPHMMRRATAVEWIRAGGDTFSLQALLGHSSQTMSRVYVELADGDVAQIHARLSLVEKLKGRR